MKRLLQLFLYFHIFYLGGRIDFTLHNKDAGFPTMMLSLLGFTVTVTSGVIAPGGSVRDDFTFNTYFFTDSPILLLALQEYVPPSEASITENCRTDRSLCVYSSEEKIILTNNYNSILC